MIYSYFESILVIEGNGKQKPEGSYKNQYQRHIVWRCGYKLVCIDDKFSRHFKSYLGEDNVYNFVDSMIKESKYCCNVMKNILKKNLP